MRPPSRRATGRCRRPSTSGTGGCCWVPRRSRRPGWPGGGRPGDGCSAGDRSARAARSSRRGRTPSRAGSAGPAAAQADRRSRPHPARRPRSADRAGNARRSGVPAALDVQERPDPVRGIDPAGIRSAIGRSPSCCTSRATACQANRKTDEGSDHPDRDAQFRHINTAGQAGAGQGDAGDLRGHQEEGTGGQLRKRRPAMAPARHPSKVNGHDFLEPDDPGRAYPYGVYDLERNGGLVNVGTDHDTGAFAVASIRGWWRADGPPLYPKTRRLAHHGRRRRQQRMAAAAVEDWNLQKLADETGLDHDRLPFPAGHKQVEQDRAPPVLVITTNWRGKPLISHEVDRQAHRRDHHPHRAAGPQRARHRAPTPRA